MTETMDHTCLSYWFPIVSKADGVNVPRTKIYRAHSIDIDWIRMSLSGAVSWPHPELGDRPALFGAIRAAALELGLPAFLRTGQGSGKHQWTETCFLPDAELPTIARHVFALAEWSEMVDMLGLPYDVWVVREMLPVKPLFTAFRDMPIVREFRLFVRTSDGEVWHAQPYWPAHAFTHVIPGGSDGTVVWKEEHREGLAEPQASILEASQRFGPLEFETLCAQAKNAAVALKQAGCPVGDWSMDFLQAANGDWYLTDMAEADKSFKWPGTFVDGVFFPEDADTPPF